MSMLDAYRDRIRELERENTRLQATKARLESELLDMTENASHARSEASEAQAVIEAFARRTSTVISTEHGPKFHVSFMTTTDAFAFQQAMWALTEGRRKSDLSPDFMPKFMNGTGYGPDD